MAQTTSTTLASDVRNYIADETLKVAEKVLRFYNLGKKSKLPSMHGKTFTYTRYERLPLPTSVLSEGTAPADTALNITQVAATAEQWGGLVTITDVAELTIAHSPFQQGIELLGMQLGETVERECYKTLLAGTTAFFGSTADDSNRAAVATSAVTQEAALKKVVATLRANGAWGMEPAAGRAEDPQLGDLYVGVVDPYVEMDIVTMTGFINANQYQNAKRLHNGEAGTLHGVRYVRTNFIPTITSAAAITASMPTAAAGFTMNADTSNIGFVVVGVTTDTGMETLVYQGGTAVFASTAAGATARIAELTMPTTAGYTWNVYVSDWATGAAATPSGARLHTSGLAAGATLAIASNAPATAAATPALLAAAGSKIHTSFFFGKDAYTVVNLQDLETYITPPGSSDSDPLAQRRKMGWKGMFKALILNQNFMARYEAESTFD